MFSLQDIIAIADKKNSLAMATDAPFHNPALEVWPPSSTHTGYPSFKVNLRCVGRYCHCWTMGKGKRKKRALPQCFRKGEPPLYRRTKDSGSPGDDQQPTTSAKYVRLTEDIDNTCQTEPRVAYMFDEDGQAIDVKMLRPRPKADTSPSFQPDSDEEKNTNRIFHLGKVEDLWNLAISGHRRHLSTCTGKLEWDIPAEKQWGLGWRERLHCKSCKYTSPPRKLYAEVDAGTPGQKSAMLNRALQVGLSHTMIGNSALSDLLLALNIPAPSHSGMQKQSNKVSSVIQQVNQADMQRRVDRLTELCSRKVGSASQSLLAVEGDCRYNNRLSSGIGKTPYQPATQAVYTICEDVTPQKNILAVVCKNKLCKKREELERSGQQVTCPHHDGCTANIQPTATIGDEQSWASEGFRSILEGRDELAIKYFTTDGDSAAFKGLEQVQAEMPTDVEPVNLRDIRHLTESLRHALDKASLSLKCFPGPTMEERKDQKKKFALEVSRRCSAEFAECFQKYPRDIKKVKETLAPVPDILVSCYAGDHSRCRDGSLVCASWKRPYIQPDLLIDPTDQDRQTLTECMLIRLGELNVEKTKMNTTTQKCEAFNRTLTRTNPKCVTWSKNFPARANSAAHLVNCGLAESTRVKLAAVGAPLSHRTRVFRQLKRKDKTIVSIRRKMRSSLYRTRRSNRRRKTYQLYYLKKEDVKYLKGILDNRQGWADHSYASDPTGFVKPSTSAPVAEHGYGADSDAPTCGRGQVRTRKVRK